MVIVIKCMEVYYDAISSGGKSGESVKTAYVRAAPGRALVHPVHSCLYHSELEGCYGT